MAPPEYHIEHVILLVIFLVFASVGTSFAQASPATTPPTARWLDLQTLSVNIRHRRIVTSTGTVGKNQAQEKTQIRARFKIDPAARYAVHVGAFSGDGFTSSWNATGLGTGDFTGVHLVKQLFLAARPVAGLELQYGGLYVEKGESSEITYYDEDGYLVGERVFVRRPDWFFFNEIMATLGSRGDLDDSNVFNRFESLDRTDYRQVQLTRQFGDAATASFDYTWVDDASTIRPAVTLQTPWTPALDQVRLEIYHRYGEDPASGFALDGSRNIGRVRVTGGYADIDPAVGEFNGDRYGEGRRLYIGASIPVVAGLNLSLFGTHTVGETAPLPNKIRTDVVLTYSFLPALRRTGLF